MVKILVVGIDRDKIDAFEKIPRHPCDRMSAAAADADDLHVRGEGLESAVA
jgi:hypothetical protein